jgi:phosphogluconate dehydratase
VLRRATNPFSADGGLKLLSGNLGRAVIKVSAVEPEHRTVEAPARVFHSQDEVIHAFNQGELARDVIVVVRFQGPRANGMPELHSLTPALTSLQSKGHRVGLVTDGRMSGASGVVPAAIHLTPEAVRGGPIAKLRDGDVIRLDSRTGELEARVSEEEWSRRETVAAELSANAYGMGRELFTLFRAHAAPAERGGGVCGGPD